MTPLTILIGQRRLTVHIMVKTGSKKWDNEMSSIDGGRLCYAAEPATDKALEPMSALVRGMSYSQWAAERKWTRPPSSDTGVTKSEMYSGALPVRQSAWWRRVCIWCAAQSVASVVHVEHHWCGHVVQGRLRNTLLHLWLDAVRLMWRMVDRRTQHCNSRSWKVWVLTQSVGKHHDQPYGDDDLWLTFNIYNSSI